MKKRLIALLALVLALVMCAGVFVACDKTNENKPDPTKAPATDPTKAPNDDDGEKTWDDLYGFKKPEKTSGVADDDCDANRPLVIGYGAFSEKFSHFYAQTAYDVDVAGMTQISLATYDRASQMVMNGIEGETRTYNGQEFTYYGPANLSVEYNEEKDQTVYTAVIRDDIQFSNGEYATIDDVIFTYYVYLDTDYSGSTSLYSFPIVGLQEYRNQVTADLNTKYDGIVADLIAAGPDYTLTGSESFTQEMYDFYWNMVKEAWLKHVNGLVNYIYTAYAKDYAANLGEGMTAEAIGENEGLKVAFGMVMWGFGGFNKEGLFTDGTNTWDLKTTFPTAEDYMKATMAAYGNNASEYFGTEDFGSEDGDFGVTAYNAIYENFAQKEMGGKSIPNIEGIKKINDWCVEVTLDGFSANAVYSILGVEISPLCYYGDKSLFDADGDRTFGFPKGDLSIVREKTKVPMGAGAYKFVKYENRIVYFEANENYYLGAPITKNIQFKETDTSDAPSAIAAGTIDAYNDLSGSKDVFKDISSNNSNGEITGDVITTLQVDNNGYGYIGINSAAVNVGGDAGSDASKNLRKAFATLFSVYRESTYDAYYGVAATTIEYPISTTSWAAPQPADDGYEVAFSKDVSGKPIYTDSMSAEEKYAAALNAALGFFEAAGYTVADGKVTAAPEGAKLSYEVRIPASGTGDHPSFKILTEVADVLKDIGITLEVVDIPDASTTEQLWDPLEAGTVEMWGAAWGGAIDPDMYQVYHSSNCPGLPNSTNSNHYRIADDTLDKLIMQARTSDDQNVRKELYKQCLDIVLDWAVEIPGYQRKNCSVISSERIKLSTVPAEVTTNYSWLAEIHTLQMLKG